MIVPCFLLLTCALMMSTIVAEIIEFSSNTSTTTTCVCTTVPCPVAGVNYLTEGGGGKGTYTYITRGGHAVVSSVTATIKLADLDHGTDTTSCTQSYSRTLEDDGYQNCDAGHILANRLGGLGNQPINIFPQNLNVNRGSYAQFEGKIYDCVKSGASSADLSWSFSYSNSTVSRTTMPVNVVYKGTFHGGSCTTLSGTFTN